MTTFEIINLSSVLVGPSIGVLLTLFIQNRKEKRDAKWRLFSTLMAFRKSYPVSYDWANSLNVISAIFHDDTEVLEKWKEFYQTLQNTGQNEHVEKARNHANLEMLSAMSKVLGLKALSVVDIDRFYTPQAHGDQANLNFDIQNELLKVLKGTQPISVKTPQSNPPKERVPDV